MQRGDEELAPQGEERVAAALGDEVPAGVQAGRRQREDRGDEHAVRSPWRTGPRSPRSVAPGRARRSAAADVEQLRPSGPAAGRRVRPPATDRGMAGRGDRPPVVVLPPYPPSGHGPTDEHLRGVRAAHRAAGDGATGPGTLAGTAPTGAVGTGHVRTTAGWRRRSSTCWPAVPVRRRSARPTPPGPSAARRWRPLVEPARDAARRLVATGHVVVTQGGRVVDPSTATGPIRIRRTGRVR